jgi:hypothetical protein
MEPSKKYWVRPALYALGVIAAFALNAFIARVVAWFIIDSYNNSFFIALIVACFVVALVLALISRGLLAALVCVFAVPLATATVLFMFISSKGSHVRQWTEDVQLDGNDQIQIERTAEFRIAHKTWNGTIVSANMSQATIEFSGPLSQLPRWEDHLTPLVLYHDVKTQEWVIVATSFACETWAWRNKPNPPYWEYRATSDGWRETPLSTSSLNRQTNLFLHFRQRIPRQHVTIEYRKRLQHSRNTAKNYQSILPTWNRHCGQSEPRHEDLRARDSNREDSSVPQ